MRSSSFSKYTTSERQRPAASLPACPLCAGCEPACPLCAGCDHIPFSLPPAGCAVALSDVSHIIYGPYTDTFIKKTAHDRADPRWACFSLVMKEAARTVRPRPRLIRVARRRTSFVVPVCNTGRFRGRGRGHTAPMAARNTAAHRLLCLEYPSGGVLRMLVSPRARAAWTWPGPLSSAPRPCQSLERWTLSKLHLQKLRLKVSGESDRTGQGPYDVVRSSFPRCFCVMLRRRVHAG